LPRLFIFSEKILSILLIHCIGLEISLCKEEIIKNENFNPDLFSK